MMVLSLFSTRYRGRVQNLNMPDNWKINIVTLDSFFQWPKQQNSPNSMLNYHSLAWKRDWIRNLNIKHFHMAKKKKKVLDQPNLISMTVGWKRVRMLNLNNPQRISASTEGCYGWPNSSVCKRKSCKSPDWWFKTRDGGGGVFWIQEVQLCCHKKLTIHCSISTHFAEMLTYVKTLGTVLLEHWFLFFWAIWL